LKEMQMGYVRLGFRILPWAIVVGLLGWQLWPWLQKRADEGKMMASLPGYQREVFTKLHLYHYDKHLGICTFHNVLSDEDTCVVEADEGKVYVYVTRRPGDPQYLHVSILTGSSPENLIDVGNVSGRSFPSYVGYMPRAGQNKDKMLGDYDLDGVFEHKTSRAWLGLGEGKFDIRVPGEKSGSESPTTSKDGNER
jgi:hypothetical protein